jgi:stearoyl-CoA desaturase (Delta-9 desaturase)
VVKADQPESDEDILYPSSLPFVLLHVACFAAIWTGVTWQAAAIGIALYWLRMFAIGAGYHRYFSHRSYSTSRVFQFLLAFLSQTTAQKSVLWWAAKHRHHHLHSDTEHDVHSPRRRGFVYAHLGWIFSSRHDKADLSTVSDLVRYPELRWLDRFELSPALILASLTFLVAGWPGLVVGFCWSTVAVYHGTFCINSLAHVHGSKRYVTGDDSRNNWFLALLTMGEGWHNNHHAYQASARQGFRWWEIDATYYCLRLLSLAGIVWDLKTPPPAVLRNEHRLGSKVVERAAADLAATFNIEAMLASSVFLTDCVGREELRGSPSDTEAVSENPTGLHRLRLPTREEVGERARTMFVKTCSIDAIAARAHGMIIDAVAQRSSPSAMGR